MSQNPEPDCRPVQPYYYRWCCYWCWCYYLLLLVVVVVVLLLLAAGATTYYFSRAGGFPKVPVTAPPVCIPFADAFQRLLTAHRKPGLCVVCLPAISAFSAIAHSTSSIVGHFPVPSCSCKKSPSVVFNVLGVALAA
jgi:hypothetical protein